MTSTRGSAIPASAGIGLRAPHYRKLVAERPPVGWLEVHSENYFGAGGQPLYFLERARDHYPLSFHGVSLSLGSSDPLDRAHLSKLKALIDRFQPGLVSEHLCWSSVDQRHFHDLLPLPYDAETLRHVSERVDAAQSFLGRQILIENITSYVQPTNGEMGEAEFVNALSAATGCGLLLDINNLYVNRMNGGEDSLRIIHAFKADAVKEIHLAGYAFFAGSTVLIDTHGMPVSDPVWELYCEAIARFGRVPTLVEWDTDIPALEVLLAEARQAQTLVDQTMSALLDYQRGFAATLINPHRQGPDLIDESAIYRNNFFSNLTAALSAAYPSCSGWSALRFLHIWRSSLLFLAHPKAATFRITGPASHNLLSAIRRLQSWFIWLTWRDLNGFCHQVFHAADCAEAAAKAMLSTAHQDCGRLRFKLHPACGLLESVYPVRAIWLSNQPDSTTDEIIDLSGGGDYLIIRRAVFAIELTAISHAAFIALVHLAAGENLESAVEAASVVDADFDIQSFIVLLLSPGVASACSLGVAA